MTFCIHLTCHNKLYPAQVDHSAVCQIALSKRDVTVCFIQEHASVSGITTHYQPYTRHRYPTIYLCTCWDENVKRHFETAFWIFLIVQTGWLSLSLTDVVVTIILNVMSTLCVCSDGHHIDGRLCEGTNSWTGLKLTQPHGHVNTHNFTTGLKWFRRDPG